MSQSFHWEMFLVVVMGWMIVQSVISFRPELLFQGLGHSTPPVCRESVKFIDSDRDRLTSMVDFLVTSRTFWLGLNSPCWGERRPPHCPCMSPKFCGTVIKDIKQDGKDPLGDPDADLLHYCRLLESGTQPSNQR